ncbi:hypothetical protein [Bacillus piscicola]|uniref:hypothetical protein n=1 Tax=Bacillus piscicola TaxID=1632684 RepID=UPI001F090109|nr:hypothetical protein [Bacillus piscicola]
MLIPKQLNWNNHMFKLREEYVTTENNVHCPLYKSVCMEDCQNCVWLHAVTEENGHTKVTCRPPVIWEETN